MSSQGRFATCRLSRTRHVWDLASESWVDPRSAEQVAEDNAEALEAARTAALARALELREQGRLPYITAIEGQEALYIAKFLEAQNCVHDPAPEGPSIHLLSDEIGVTGGERLTKLRRSS